MRFGGAPACLMRSQAMARSRWDGLVNYCKKTLYPPHEIREIWDKGLKTALIG